MICLKKKNYQINIKNKLKVLLLKKTNQTKTKYATRFWVFFFL